MNLLRSSACCVFVYPDPAAVASHQQWAATAALTLLSSDWGADATVGHCSAAAGLLSDSGSAACKILKASVVHTCQLNNVAKVDDTQTSERAKCQSLCQ